MAEFSIASNSKYKEIEKTEYTNCVTWFSADFVESHVKKGMKVLVQAHKETEQYEGKYYTKAIVSEINVLKWPKPVNNNETLPPTDGIHQSPLMEGGFDVPGNEFNEDDLPF